MENRITIEGLYKAGYNAHRNTSFEPERRAENLVKEYEAQLNEDLQTIPEAEKEKYIENYKKHLFSWLSAKSQCISSMITGPANFPVRRAEKANRSEHNRYTEFSEWRTKVLKSIAKKIEDSKPEDVKEAEAWQCLERNIRRSAAVIEGVNNGTQPYSKQLLVSSIYTKVETYAKHGNVGIVDLAIALMRELNQKSSIITERHKFFKLPELAKAMNEREEKLKKLESQEIPFEGGKVVKNFAEDRLQIIYDSKPEDAVLTKLKQNAFRWSPRFGAWQRQLTVNAFHAVIRVVPLKLEQLRY